MGRAGWAPLLKEGAGPLGPRRCAPAEAMAGGVARPRRLPAKRMVFEWPSWWARRPRGIVISSAGFGPGLAAFWEQSRRAMERQDAAGFSMFEWPTEPSAEECELCARAEPCSCGPDGCRCSCGRCMWPGPLPGDGPVAPSDGAG